MILRRLGNKRAIAKDIIKCFPKHSSYIEPFFGAGGMFFNKPKASHNLLNDIDSDVFNLFQVAATRAEELLEAFNRMPLHMDLFKYWRKNKEADPIRKALRFILLSNYGFLGHPDTFKLIGGKCSYAENFESNLELTAKLLFGCHFANMDFRNFLKGISFKAGGGEEAKTLIYCDPPYLNTTDNYSHSFTEQDSIDLFNALDATKCKFAMSEFDNEFIISQAEERGLNVIYIRERQNIRNRRTEILVTNYENENTLF